MSLISRALNRLKKNRKYSNRLVLPEVVQCSITMTNFTGLFTLAVLVNIGVTLRSTGLWKNILDRLGYGDGSTVALQQEGQAEKDKEHRELLKKYLLVYLLATMSDWLQGPYVYALYADYGYDQHDIAVLFVAGFGSSK